MLRYWLIVAQAFLAAGFLLTIADWLSLPGVADLSRIFLILAFSTYLLSEKIHQEHPLPILEKAFSFFVLYTLSFLMIERHVDTQTTKGVLKFLVPSLFLVASVSISFQARYFSSRISKDQRKMSYWVWIFGVIAIACMGIATIMHQLIAWKNNME